MDKAAIVVATNHLARARTALQVMENAEMLSEIEAAWSDFLVAANRVFSKLEQGSKKTGKSKGWFGRKRHDQKNDPMLCYVHHARNADEHGISYVTEKDPGGIGLGSGPGTWGIQVIGGQMSVTALGGQVSGQSKFFDFIPARVRLIRVYDRGKPYDPPIGTPVEAAKKTIAHLETIIAEARELPD